MRLNEHETEWLRLGTFPLPLHEAVDEILTLHQSLAAAEQENERLKGLLKTGVAQVTKDQATLARVAALPEQFDEAASRSASDEAMVFRYCARKIRAAVSERVVELTAALTPSGTTELV